MSIQDIFEKLGLTSAKWQWKAARWDRKLDRLRGRLSGTRQRVGYQHKFCPQCGSIVDREDSECPRCGAHVGSWRAQAAGRALTSLIPGGSVTSALIIANLAIYLAGVLVAGFGALMMPPDSFSNAMAMVAPLFVRGQYWRIFTYAYLHFGAIHILFNMFALYQAGSVLEEEIGWVRFFAVYNLALLGGGLLNLFSGLIIPQYMAGASGAVFGLIGFGAAYGHFLGGPRGEALRGFFMRWVVYALIFTFLVPGISISAHLGGLLTGAACGYLVERERIRRESLTPVWRGAARILLAATIIAFAWMLLAAIA